MQVDAKGEKVEEVLPDGGMDGGEHLAKEKIDAQDQEEPETQVEGPYAEDPPYVEVPDADIPGPFLFGEQEVEDQESAEDEEEGHSITAQVADIGPEVIGQTFSLVYFIIGSVIQDNQEGGDKADTVQVLKINSHG